MPLPCLILTSSHHLATSFVGSERDWQAQSVSFGWGGSCYGACLRAFSLPCSKKCIVPEQLPSRMSTRSDKAPLKQKVRLSAPLLALASPRRRCSHRECTQCHWTILIGTCESVATGSTFTHHKPSHSRQQWLFGAPRRPRLIC
jgi:hypothetical protein